MYRINLSLFRITLYGNISRRKQTKESVILPQYFISHRVITSSEGGNFSSRTFCLSLKCTMLVLLLSLSWPQRYITLVDWFVMEVQIYYDRWFGLIDCEIGVASELENRIMYIKPVWLFVARSVYDKSDNPPPRQEKPSIMTKTTKQLTKAINAKPEILKITMEQSVTAIEKSMKFTTSR